VLSKEETVARLPTLEREGLRGGTVYHDGQFDDARLAVNLAQTAAEHGATVANYVEVVELRKVGGFVTGVVAVDAETGRAYELRARVVVNATGAFSDAVRRLDDSSSPPIIRPSQGVHIVLAKDFLPGDEAVMVPHTSDGRIIFMIPWYGRVVVGTTDTPVDAAVAEPVATEAEIDFLLETSARYLSHDPTRADIRAVFVGIRPLVRGVGEEGTAALSREHTIAVSEAGLVTIAGGKWTTYRKMAEDTVDVAADLAQLPERACATKFLRIHGHVDGVGERTPFAEYGSDASALSQLVASDASFAERIHPAFEARVGQVVWAARHEMARTVDDVLARRTRMLFLDTRASLAAAPQVAKILAAELGRDTTWERDQLQRYRSLAESHLLA
jgi:glycerol-3-phosphate dehydrogenase